MRDVAALAARNHAEHNLAYAEALGGRVLLTADLVAVDVASPATFLNNAVPLRPHDAGEIAPVVAGFFGGSRHGVADYFGSLDLTGYGYTPADPMPVMVREPSPLPAAAPDGLAIGPVRDVPELAVFERVMVDGMGIAALAGAPPYSLWAPPVLDRPSPRFHVGRVGGVPVACAAAVVVDECVGIYAVGTLPAHRRRGYGTALTVAALAAAPPLPAVLSASPLGLGVYASIGFVPGATRVNWASPG